MPEVTIRSDEPTSQDRLNRNQYAEAFARLAEDCETPLVIGLYGGWGVGKTSLMRLIEAKLDESKTRPVWFDPWRHQFDESPALALVHTVVDEFGMEEEGKKLLTVIAGAFGSALLKATTTIALKDVDELGKRFEEERFQVREARVRLQKHFEKLIQTARGTGEQKKRIVFFIDDLDRCMPPQALSLLEALKLYLNLEGCVYFLGVDRHALEKSIQYHYKDLELSETSYLDKIVQLPFTIPPIAPESMEEFVTPLLSEGLEGCKELLVKGLGDNPRGVKRFINTLTLNHQLASQLGIPGYNPGVLTLVLLIQYRAPSLYRLVGRQPALLGKLREESEETKPLHEGYLARDERLRDVVTSVEVPIATPIEPYIYLSQVAKVRQVEHSLDAILVRHTEWVESGGERGQQLRLSDGDLTADLRGVSPHAADRGRVLTSGAELVGADLRDADLRKAALDGIILFGALLSGANLRGADLRGADLRTADIKRANLRQANLLNADLSEADLREALLSWANLGQAHLNRADLTAARLGAADLREANLHDARLTNADLRAHANLEGARGVTEAQLASARTDETTTLPDGSKGPFKKGSGAHLPKSEKPQI